MLSAQRLRKSANRSPPPSFSMFMCTQPVLPGTIPVLQWFAAERFHVGLTHV